MSVMELRALPLEVYTTQEAQQKLQYVIVADLSINDIEKLPGLFLESLTVCQHLVRTNFYI